ncbi:hypothetical protein ABIB00_007004 [Bradyrhizobium sp. LB14.3]|uniref:hypothetical protein n=1 Tax=Bradyrhizobium sp. LB14.3 TaxID=3156328 RepID=UPI0033952870
MTGPLIGSDRQILLCARRYVALVAEHRKADHNARQLLQTGMNRLLESITLEIEAEKRRRAIHLELGIRCFVRDRKPFNRVIDASEAEAVRHYYSTPPAPALDALSGEDCVLLGDLFEGWAQDKRQDPRMMIELLGWSDGMRILAQTVGRDYDPPPWPEGVKVPLLKFIVNRIRAAD